MRYQLMESAMRPLRISENIVPVSEFKANAAEWLRRVGERHEPVVITQNGKAAGVLLSPGAYDELLEQHRFVQSVERGLADADAGRTTPHAEVVAAMRGRFHGGDDA